MLWLPTTFGVSFPNARPFPIDFAFGIVGVNWKHFLVIHQSHVVGMCPALSPADGVAKPFKPTFIDVFAERKFFNSSRSANRLSCMLSAGQLCDLRVTCGQDPYTLHHERLSADEARSQTMQQHWDDLKRLAQQELTLSMFHTKRSLIRLVFVTSHLACYSTMTSLDL